jgi:hypothetical protein
VLDAGGKKLFDFFVCLALGAGRSLLVVGGEDLLETKSAFAAFEFVDGHGVSVVLELLV